MLYFNHGQGMKSNAGPTGACALSDRFADSNTKRLNYEGRHLIMKTTNWKTWAKAAIIRAVRTFAEAMLAYIGTGALVLGDVNWLAALSAGGFGFITALLMALTGLPEAGQE